jgi:ferric-dicitrate binding protein FerR (iron transport regulator)
MTQIVDWDRLARYVARESSPAERAEVERWLAQDPSRQALLDQVQRRWAAASIPADVDVDRAWARVDARIKDPSRQAISDDVVLGDVHDAGPAAGFNVRRYALPLAAGLVLAIGVTYWQLREPGAAGVTLAGAGTEYVVPRGGSQRSVTLGDSTEVILASASRLVVAEDYGRGSRTVDLEGEALFRVRHDATRPFRVRAGSIVAEDLGTEFVVRRLQLSGAETVRIAVREGIVAVRSGDAPGARDTLRPRDVALASDTTVLVRRDQDLDAYFAWSRGQLVFDNTPLSEVAAELSRWFDLDIAVDSSIASRPLSAPILTTTPIDEVLQIVGSSTDVKVERNGRVVRFSGPGYSGALPARAGPAREVAG